MIIRFVCLVFLAFSLFTGRAQAQEYAPISWVNLIHTMIRFNAINMSDQNILDEYAIVSEYDLYKTFFKDDFKWNQVREAIKDSIRLNIATYPTNYFHDLTVRLDRYDFEAKLFRLDAESVLRGVNSFALLAVRGTGCEKAKVEYLPRSFRAVLSAPVYLDGLPLSEGDAKALLERMKIGDNPKRIIFARYNFRTVYIEPMHKIERDFFGQTKMRYAQTKAGSSDVVRLDMRLDSIGFYEDPQRTKLVYLFTP